MLPVLQYGSLFSVLWQDNPLGASQFIATKSVFSIAHQDPRSGLNLWTYEVDSISLLIYIACAWFFTLSLRRYLISKEDVRQKRAFYLATAACITLCFSFTYMTAIEHCAGPTWIGFVALYGSGFDEFQLHPAYQTGLMIFGLLLIATAVYLMRKKINKVQEGVSTSAHPA